MKRGEECGGMFERLYEEVVWETQSTGESEKNCSHDQKVSCLIPRPILRYGNETVY